MHRESPRQVETPRVVRAGVPDELDGLRVSSIYFNRARSPVTVTLRTGEASLVRPKGQLVVTVEQDGSPSLLAMVRKGILQRERVSVPVVSLQEPVPPSPPPPLVPPVSVPLEREVQVVSEESSPVEEDSSEKPSVAWSKVELAAFARTKGITVESRWSKAALLRAIQEAGW